MKKTATLSAIAILALSLAPVPANAIERVNTTRTSCAAIQGVLSRDGAAILRYPSKRIANYTLYDRYVASSRFCRIGERAVTAYVPARDTNSCRVFKCEEVEPLFDCDDLFAPRRGKCRK